MGHSLSTSEQYRQFFESESSQVGVSPNALQAIMMVEGSGIESISPAGARGIMQTMPGWWSQEELENWLDPRIQIRTGARALKAKWDGAVGQKGDQAQWRDAAARYFGGTIESPLSGYGMDTLTYVSLFDSAFSEVNALHSGSDSGEIEVPVGGSTPLPQDTRNVPPARAYGPEDKSTSSVLPLVILLSAGIVIMVAATRE